MPVGMHRPKPSKWKNVWPFLAILVIVPALGWVAATALYRQQATNVSVQPVPATSSSAKRPPPGCVTGRCSAECRSFGRTHLLVESLVLRCLR